MLGNTCAHTACRTTAPCRLRGLPAVYEVAEFVRDHAVLAEVRDGVVWGREVSVDRAGNVFREWQAIGTTVRQAREWLGY